MITVWFGGGQAGGCFASGMGPPWGLSSRSGIPWGRPWVLRGPQGSARRAGRSEPLWFPGVLLPGGEGRWGACWGGGRGGGGGAPAVGGGREGVMVAGRLGGWRVFAGA